MEASDRQSFVKGLLSLAEIFGKPLTSDVIELWWSILRNWPLDEFLTAAKQLAIANKFMPTPYDFEALRTAGRLTPDEAWIKVLDHAGGAYRQGELGIPLIDTAVRTVGGYQQIAHYDRQKLIFLKNNFCDCYKDLEEAEKIREAAPELANDGASRRLIGA